MPQPTYRARVVVLRKTKLGESDLVVTMLAEDGSQLRAVAKGARKPASPFASRLELYAISDALLARGRSLDIVKEARLVEGNERLRLDMEHAAGAAPCAELLARVSQTGLSSPKLFPLTAAAFRSLGRADAAHVPGIAAAHLLKTFAFAGLRPSLEACCVCGRPQALPARGEETVPLALEEGGVVCPACRARTEALLVPASVVERARALLAATFPQIEAAEPEVSASFGALRLAQAWSRSHVGARLRSLEFLFTCGLF